MKNNELPRWRLNSIAEEVGGTIEYLNCNDSKNEWKKHPYIFYLLSVQK